MNQHLSSGGSSLALNLVFKSNHLYDHRTLVLAFDDLLMNNPNSGGRNEFMVNLNTVEKIELESSCKLTPKILKRMPFAIYDHLSFFVNDKFIFCSGHKRPGVVRIGQNIFMGYQTISLLFQ